MRKIAVAAIGIAILITAGVLSTRGEVQAAAPASAAQTSAVAMEGVVSSEREGPMEGVVVSARGAGSTMRTSVSTDRQGRYAFPASTLAPGRYQLAIRAVGYDLVDPGAVEVKRNAAAKVDLRLQPAKNLAAQLTNAEWRLSLPGTDDPSERMECVGCHTLERVVRSRHDDKAWLDVLHRMSTYYPGSGAVAMPTGGVKLPWEVRRNDGRMAPMAKYLASINMSHGGSELRFPLKTLPRPTGRSTRAVITEYDLPRKDAQPHEVAVADDGMVWYTDFASRHVGVLDPRTGATKEWEVPIVRPNRPTGATDIEFDRDGNPWFSVFFQMAVARFDRKAEKFQMFMVPDEFEPRARQGMLGVPPKRAADQRVWYDVNTHSRMIRIDPITGKQDVFESYPAEGGEGDDYYAPGGFNRSGHSMYGVEADAQGNGWWSDITGNNLGRVDGKTGQVRLFKTPGEDPGPRRFRFDDQDRLWYAEYRGNHLGMLEPKTGQFRRWLIPTPHSKPYDVDVDKNGNVWGGGMWTDRIFRFDPNTETITEYLLPSPTNTRRVDVNPTLDRVALWTGSNHGAKLVRVEPLD